MDPSLEEASELEKKGRLDFFWGGGYGHLRGR